MTQGAPGKPRVRRPRPTALTLSQAVGSVLRDERVRRHITQAELAQRAHVTQAHVSKAEHGGASLETISALAGELELELSVLFARVERALARDTAD